MKVYDKDHHYLGQYYSSDKMMGYNIVQDTAVIKEYGIYYVKVSKPGYRTVGCKMELIDDVIQYSPEIVMKPANTYLWWVLVIVIVVGIGGYRLCCCRKQR